MFKVKEEGEFVLVYTNVFCVRVEIPEDDAFVKKVGDSIFALSFVNKVEPESLGVKTEEDLVRPKFCQFRVETIRDVSDLTEAVDWKERMQSIKGVEIAYCQLTLLRPQELPDHITVEGRWGGTRVK